MKTVTWINGAGQRTRKDPRAHGKRVCDRGARTDDGGKAVCSGAALGGLTHGLTTVTKTKSKRVEDSSRGAGPIELSGENRGRGCWTRHRL